MTKPQAFRFISGERVVEDQFCFGESRQMQYFINDDSIAKLLSSTLPPVLADFVEVAAAIHIADRLALRKKNSSEEWQRQLRVDIPVRCLADWKRTEVTDRLCRLLSFLTGDSWEFQFSSRPGRLRNSESQGNLFAVERKEPICVSLFSGGLDALAGTVASLIQNPEHHLVCVSGSPNTRQEYQQIAQINKLRKIAHKSITHIRVPCWLKSGSEISQEPTRRTRGMLFLALGAVSALSAGVNCLHLYENGIGAINLPYERTPTGIPNSRSVHPYTLFLIAEFIQVITGQPFSIKNSCVFNTKAEMCRHGSVQQLSSVIEDTFSCDGFPVQRSQMPQCGVCISCILRRQALYSAGLRKADLSGYAFDLYKSDQIISLRRLRGIEAMEWQATRLADALQQGWAGLMQEFPDLRLACTSLSCLNNESVETIQQRLMGLYEHHVHEWQAFPARTWLASQQKAA